MLTWFLHAEKWPRNSVSVWIALSPVSRITQKSRGSLMLRKTEVDSRSSSPLCLLLISSWPKNPWTLEIQYFCSPVPHCEQNSMHLPLSLGIWCTSYRLSLLSSCSPKSMSHLPTQTQTHTHPQKDSRRITINTSDEYRFSQKITFKQLLLLALQTSP